MKNYLKRIDSVFDNVLNLQIGFLSDDICDNVSLEMSGYRLEISKIRDMLQNNETLISEIILKNIDLVLLDFDMFFEKYYPQTGNRGYLINCFAVKTALNQIKMINNLSSAIK